MQRTSGFRAAVDPGTEEGRSFLQQRLALFGKWFFVAALAFYVLANLPLDVAIGKPFDWVDEWFGAKERLTLAVVAVAGMMWLGASGQPRALGTLHVIDAAGTIGACVLLSPILFERVIMRQEGYDALLVLIAATNVVTVRAILVPSSARRTLVISLAAMLVPVAVIAATTLMSRTMPLVSAANLSMAALVWAGIAVASATATSRMLFQLRVQVQKAQRLGQYTLEHKLGEGAMGVVYRASHAMLRRPTAVKLLAPGKNREADLRRFEREVQRTALLTHPNTVAIYDYGRTPAGVFYYAMELLDGITLQELVDLDGPQPPARVIHILRQACGALQEAHAAGLIHRDVKPANIMLCERGELRDVVKVLDFGLVKDADAADPALSAADGVIGTPLYMAPETIADPSTVTSSVDLYGLGAVGYLLLTGTPVFEAKTVAAVCGHHLSTPPTPPSQRLGRSLPADLEAAILRCLAKRPEERPASAAELDTLLAACTDAGSWSVDAAGVWWRELRTRSQTTGMRVANAGKATMDVDLGRRDPPASSSAPPPS